MGLNFGWRARDTRETIWRGDPALKDVPPSALEAWREDGDASHLQPYATAGKPTVFTFRCLTLDENRVALALLQLGAEGTDEGGMRCLIACFRMGVAFPDVPAIRVDDPMEGMTDRSTVQRERGLLMLAEPFVAHLERTYPGMVAFYGGLVFKATFPSEAEKKVSSPPSTPTPSSAVGSTASQVPAAAMGAQDAAGPPSA